MILILLWSRYFIGGIICWIKYKTPRKAAFCSCLADPEFEPFLFAKQGDFPA